MEPTREIYWNISLGGLIYAFALVATGFLVWGVYQRYRLWQLGGAEARFDRIPERLRGLLIELFGQRRHLRDPVPGIAHLFIFYGFVAMLVATGLIANQENTGIHFLKGTFYLWYSLISDLFGILAIVGLCMAIWRRAVTRPARLHSVMDDWISLGLLLLIFLQGFAIEGMRIAATELQQQPELARWSPGGYVFALAFQSMGSASVETLHRFTWWFHAVTVFAFLSWFVFGKFKHVLFGMANIFFRNLGTTGKLSHPDIEALVEEDEEALESLGVNRIEQLSWKSLLDLDACVDCGRCEAVCPAHASGVPLNPRKLIQDMDQHLSAVGPGLLSAAGSGESTADEETAVERPLLFGDGEDEGPKPALLEAELWGCRTCGACMQECPMYIEHIPKIVDMRRHLVMSEAKMGEDAQMFLSNIDERGHPFVGTTHDREGWFRDLDVKVFGRGDSAEYLFWVGCSGALVDRNIEVSRAMVKVLQAAGVDFALLGAEEACTGDPARRAGGELTFQDSAKGNIEIFEQYGIEKIIATCPHCFNTLGHEYPDFGGKYEVIHHSELIRDLIHEGRLNLRQELDSVTYHDPCYLGRHNDVYDAPREVIAGVAKAGGMRELEKNRSRADCCGSGGGYAWMDDDPKKRINHTRLEQVQECGAKTTAVSCPFCMQMFEDALSALDPDQTMRAADIAELVAENLVEENLAEENSAAGDAQ